jgi:hypothetical protein
MAQRPGDATSVASSPSPATRPGDSPRTFATLPGRLARQETLYGRLSWHPPQRKLCLGLAGSMSYSTKLDEVREQAKASATLRFVREMFSLKSNQMVEKSVCIGLRASCRVCARPAKWRA